MYVQTVTSVAGSNERREKGQAEVRLLEAWNFPFHGYPFVYRRKPASPSGLLFDQVGIEVRRLLGGERE